MSHCRLPWELLTRLSDIFGDMLSRHNCLCQGPPSAEVTSHHRRPVTTAGTCPCSEAYLSHWLRGNQVSKRRALTSERREAHTGSWLERCPADGCTFPSLCAESTDAVSECGCTEPRGTPGRPLATEGQDPGDGAGVRARLSSCS